MRLCDIIIYIKIIIQRSGAKVSFTEGHIITMV